MTRHQSCITALASLLLGARSHMLEPPVREEARPLQTDSRINVDGKGVVMSRTTRRGGLRVALALACAWTWITEPLAAQGRWPGDALDYGIGIVAFAASAMEGMAEGEDAGAEFPRADTMLVLQAPAAGAPIVARFILRRPEAFSWSYALEAEEVGVEGNTLEFDYEELGVPVDSLAPGGEWVRVIYGFAAAEPRYGWVRREEGREERRTRVILWERELLDGGRSLFFSRPAGGLAFYDGPRGERVRLDLVATEDPPGDPLTADFDYRLEPLEIVGRWMKVRVVTPDYSCQFDEGPTREEVVWIEYLDESGRPRVWYYARGC